MSRICHDKSETQKIKSFNFELHYEVTKLKPVGTSIGGLVRNCRPSVLFYIGLFPAVIR